MLLLNMLDNTLHNNSNHINSKFLESIDSILTNKKQYSKMNPNILILLNILETILLKSIINTTLLYLIEDMNKLTQCKLSLNLNSVLIDHKKTISLSHSAS